MRVHWLGWLGLLAAPFAACGPDPKPSEPCNGPTFDLTVRAEDGPLPADTRIKVRYGGNHEGESYALGQSAKGQAVFCTELTTQGGAPSEQPVGASSAGGQGGAAGAQPEGLAGSGAAASSGVWTLQCFLYTQGPAQLDATATGYESIENQDLTLTDEDRCQVSVPVELKRELDAGK